MRSKRQLLQRVLARLVPERVTSPQTMIECHGLQRVLHAQPHPRPLMTVPHERAKISLLGGRHPDRGETILCQQLQKRARTPPIMLLLPCLRLADVGRMTYSAFDPQFFQEL